MREIGLKEINDQFLIPYTPFIPIGHKESEFLLVSLSTVVRDVDYKTTLIYKKTQSS
jgi:hypothetical protein